MNDDLRRYHRNLVLVGVLVPLAITLVGFVLFFAWLPRLPGEIAMHWNAAGEVDGYGAPIALPLVTTAITLILVAISVGSSWSPIGERRSV